VAVLTESAMRSFATLGGWRLGVAGLLVCCLALGAGCEASTSDRQVQSVEVPSEIVAQLSSIERAMNGGNAIELEPIFDDRASIQSVALLGYGSKKQFLDTIGAADSRAPFRFGRTALVSERSGKIRTVTEVVRRFGDEEVVERVTHDWVRQVDRWVVKEQSFADWSPLVGRWWRSDDDGRVELKFMPSGIFEMFDKAGVSVRRGVYATGSNEVTFTPDALGSGATDERPIDASFKFEFDGSLAVSVDSGGEAPGLPSLGGVWRRWAAP
jgi:hypothetical protein